MGRHRLPRGPREVQLLPGVRIRKASQKGRRGQDFKEELKLARQRIDAVVWETKVSWQREQQMEKEEARKGAVLEEMQILPRRSSRRKTEPRRGRQLGDGEREARPGTFCLTVRSLVLFSLPWEALADFVSWK